MSKPLPRGADAPQLDDFLSDVPHVSEEIVGWGRYPRCDGKRYRPAKLSTLRRLVGAGGLTPRGAGRSYGDAALPGGHAGAGVVDLTAIDCFCDFDAALGTVRVEAGLTLQQLLAVIVPRGWFLPVVPGTAACTLGGMVAADVHGKNHIAGGSLQSHVRALTLLLPTGGQLRCSPSNDPELFAATFGGMGLTGVVLDIELQLQRINSAWLQTTTDTYTGLDGMLAALLDAPQQYVVGWLDGMTSNAQLGRSVLIGGDFIAADEYRAGVAGAAHLPPLHVSWDAPRSLPPLTSWFVHPTTVRLHNRWYFDKAGRAGVRYEPLHRFFFPLDRWCDWHRAYGDSGFVQYQFVVPNDAASELIRTAIDALQSADHWPYLVVLKRLGAGQGMLSFPMPGITVAIDIPHRPGLERILDDLDRRVIQAGGRVYLAKDSRLSAASLRSMYPDCDRFLAVQQRIDPGGQLTSALAERLQLVPAAAERGAR
ncbi:MAG: FAD-binding oxidoreductase [Planctomycetota bacterium]